MNKKYIKKRKEPTIATPSMRIEKAFRTYNYWRMVK